jgi:hypothetical protein
VVSIAYVAAWLLPALAGAGAWLALRSVRTTGDGFAAIGAGWLIGIVGASELADLFARDATAHAFAHVWPWLAAIGVAAWIVAVARMRTMSMRAPPRDGARRFVDVIAALLLAMIVVRIATIGYEASMRPVFPWDAWSAWATKPKTWFELGHYERYVPMAEWLKYPAEPLRTASAWNYPELLAWTQLWFASAAGAWNEPLVDLAWCGALVAFALAAYGYSRGFGLARWLGIALVYAFVSLPLVDAHVALAGYADLWLAVVLGLASFARARWLIRRERGQAFLAIAAAACLPAIKLEGAVWSLAFAAIVLVDFVPVRRRTMIVGTVSGLIAIIVGTWLVVAGGTIDVPPLGSFEFAWHGVGDAIATSLFSLPNWHLLWYALPVLLIWRGSRFTTDIAARRIGTMLLIDFGFLFVLFFFTTASAWATDFTSANRLILQLVPSVFALASLLLRPAERSAGFNGGTPRIARTSVAPIARA